MARLFLVLGLLMCGCSGSISVKEPPAAKTSFNEPNGKDATLVTIEHDGHKFVVLVGWGARGALIHHPGCECLKKAEKE